MSASVLFICEKYYLRFYRPLAARLARCGIRPIWIALDGWDEWDHDSLDPTPAVATLVDASDVGCRTDIDALCAFERAVFARPELFRANYPYTLNVVGSLERAKPLADAWHRLTTALLARFSPHAVFLWNGRYLPYRAVSAACEAARQLVLTSEIGWIPGTIFVDRGALTTNTTDLFGRRFDDNPSTELGRADAFLDEYTARKATMVAQTLVPPSQVRQRVSADNEHCFLLLYGCQVDWDTNIVLGATRFRTNEAAVGFLMKCLAPIHDAHLIVKTHPLDSHQDHDRLREIIGDRGSIVSDVHPHALIEAADCVAVRNSTLGFEALCYGKPVLALEDAKYRHPRLTLEAADVADGTNVLRSVSNRMCRLPDPVVLRQFVLHLLDHYLMPVRYAYHFEPAKLALLAHLERSEAFTKLEHLLTQVAPSVISSRDDAAAQALDECQYRHASSSRSFLRHVRRLAQWMSS